MSSSGGTRFRVQVGSVLAIQVAGLGLGLLTTALLARWLGAAGKGTLELALLLPDMLALFLSGGVGVANVYFAGARRFDTRTLAANAVTFALLGTVAGLGLVGVLLAAGWLQALLPGVPTRLILVALPGLAIALLRGYFATLLQGLQRITAVNLADLAQNGLLLLLIIVLVGGAGLGLLGALVVALAARLAGLLVLAFFLHREGAALTPRWDPPVMRATLAFGLRGHVGNMLQFFNYRLDTFIVNYYLGPAGVGVYSVAVRLAELLWQLPNAVGFVIFPRAAASSAAEMNRFTPRVFRLTLGLTAIGAAGLALIGQPLIVLVFSASFGAAYLPMLALLPGVVLLGSAKVLTNEIAGRGYPHYNSINSGLALILTVVFDVLLIPRYGILGAALASSIAYTLIFLVTLGVYPMVQRRSTAREE